MSGRALSERMRMSVDAWADYGYTEQYPSLDKFITEVSALESRLALVERQLEKALAEPDAENEPHSEHHKHAIRDFIRSRRERIVGGGE